MSDTIRSVCYETIPSDKDEAGARVALYRLAPDYAFPAGRFFGANEDVDTFARSGPLSIDDRLHDRSHKAGGILVVNVVQVVATKATAEHDAVPIACALPDGGKWAPRIWVG